MLSFPGLDQIFDSAYYLDRNPDVAAAVEAGVVGSAKAHYEDFGINEGRLPSSLVEQFFDTQFYLGSNPDVAAAVANGVFSNGLEHFLLNGQFEGRDPNVFFQTQTYLADNPDVAAALAAGIVPSAFTHFVANGAAEDRAAGNEVASAIGDVMVDGVAVTDLPGAGGSLQVGSAAEGSANLGNGAGMVLTSDNFDNVVVGGGNDGTLTVSAGTLETFGIDATIQVGRFGGNGTLIAQDGAFINGFFIEAGRDGSGTIIARGEGTHVVASNDVGRFSGEFADEAGFVRVGRDDGASGQLEIRDGATLTIRPGESANQNTSGPGLQVANSLGSSGSVLIDAATLEILQGTAPVLSGFTPFVQIGRGGDGSFTAQNGARVIFSGGQAEWAVGRDDGAVGTMVVTGEGTTFEHLGEAGGLFVGGFGTLGSSGSMTVSDGASLTTNNLQARGSDSEIIVTGQDSEVLVTSANGVPFPFDQGFENEGGFIRVGRNDGENAVLQVLDGAHLQVDGSDGQQNPGIFAARNPGSSAEILVDGEGTRVDIIQSAQFDPSLGGPFLQAGNSGGADTTIQNGAVLSIEGPAAGAQISRGNGDGQILDPSSFNVQSGGKFLVTGIDALDQDFFTGVTIAQESNAVASVLVSGAGSEFIVNSTVLSFITVGERGQAEMTISNGGLVSTLFMGIGGDVGGQGEVTVQGVGSVLELTGVDATNGDAGFVTVGRSGEGILDVISGGSVLIPGGDALFPGLQAGRNAGSIGEINVDGAGSNILVTGTNTSETGAAGDIIIGRFGDGTLNVTNGGQVVNDSDDTTASFVGREIGGLGEVSVTGANSLFDAGEILVIGAGFDFDTDEVLFDAGGTGLVTVGGGGTIQAGAAMGDGVGDIFIGTGGTLEVLVGGMLIGDVVNEGGSFIPGNSSGVVGIAGDLSHESGDLEFEFSGIGEGQFDRIEVGGQASLDGGLELIFIDGYMGQVGDSFEILTAGNGLTINGELEYTVAGLGDGLEVDLSVGDTSLIVSILSDADVIA